MKWVETIFQKNKRAIKALLNMFAFFAVIHIGMAILLVLKHSDLSYLNVFYIESISAFYPGIEKGAISFAISVIIIAAVYIFFYLQKSKK